MAQSVTYITETELTGDLKNVYSDIRTELFPIITLLMASMKKMGPNGPESATWGGNGLYFDVVTGPELNWSYSQTGQLPFSSDAAEVQGNVGITRFYVTRAFDNLAIVGTQSKQSAFISLRNKISRAFDNTLKMGMQETLQGNATGIKAIVSSSADTTHFVATSPYGVSGAGQGGLWIYPGMYVSVLDTTGLTVRGTAQVSAVTNSGDNVTATLASAISGMVSTDIVVQGNQSGNAYNQYANGLINMTNRGGSYATLHGLSASTYPRWNALQFVAGTDTSFTTPTELDVWQLAMKNYALGGEDAIANPKQFIACTTIGVQLQLIQTVIGTRTLPTTGSAKIALPGGYEADQILGIPLIADPYTPAGTFYLAHMPSLRWVDAADWAPVQYESSGAVRFISGQDAFETSYRQYFNTMCTRRNALASITGYTDTARYTPVV